MESVAGASIMMEFMMGEVSKSRYKERAKLLR